VRHNRQPVRFDDSLLATTCKQNESDEADSHIASDAVQSSIR